MKRHQLILRSLALSSVLLTSVPVACNSILAKKSATSDSDEYYYVDVLGSNIPQKIKKGTKYVPMSQVEGMSGENFARGARTQGAPKLPASN